MYKEGWHDDFQGSITIALTGTWEYFGEYIIIDLQRKCLVIWMQSFPRLKRESIVSTEMFATLHFCLSELTKFSCL